jgi:hypothetical protein
VESYVAVLEAFLAAGIDPTNISGKVPTDYLLCRKSLEHDIFCELSSLEGSVTAGALFYLAKNVFNRSVRAHEVSSHYKSETSRKRKLTGESEAGESSGQSEQEGDNSHGVESGTKDKRLKPSVEQGVVSELSDGNDVIFLAERPVHRDQKVEVKENN